MKKRKMRKRIRDLEQDMDRVMTGVKGIEEDIHVLVGTVGDLQDRFERLDQKDTPQGPVVHLDPPMRLTCGQIFEIHHRSRQNVQAGGTGESLIYAYTTEGVPSVLEGSGDVVEESEGNGVWIDPNGSRNHGGG